MQDVELTWGDRLRKEGLEQGLEQGLEKGIVQGKRETLKRLLSAKFGALPEPARDRIDALSSAEELDLYLDRVLTASKLEDVGLGE